jgi:hypothetical protein
VETQGEFVMSLAAEVRAAAYHDIRDVVEFVHWLDEELSFLVCASVLWFSNPFLSLSSLLVLLNELRNTSTNFKYLLCLTTSQLVRYG